MPKILTVLCKMVKCVGIAKSQKWRNKTLYIQKKKKNDNGLILLCQCCKLIITTLLPICII